MSGIWSILYVLGCFAIGWGSTVSAVWLIHNKIRRHYGQWRAKDPFRWYQHIFIWLDMFFWAMVAVNGLIAPFHWIAR